MLRILSLLLVLSACSMGAIKTGGEEAYLYDAKKEYTSSELQELSNKVVITSKRDPQVGKLDDLFGKGQKPLKRIGIVIFESEIQPTRGGLSGDDLVYLSEQGKQLVTEKLLSVWEQNIKLMNPEVDYVSLNKIKKSKVYQRFGLAENDYIKTNRESIDPDDIFYLESKRKTTSTTLLNPRGTRDMSFALVPAYELMGGPKWSEHNKHFINDVSKDLNLDALIIVMSQISWTSAHTDKFSGDFIPEGMTLKVKASTLVPLHSYHSRLKTLKTNATPGVTLCYRTYESEIKIPAVITVNEEEKKFSTIETNIINPMFKTYNHMTSMTWTQIIDDLKKTW
jgi:hypothetical protein